MKKTILALLFASSLLSAENLLRNGSFEDADSSGGPAAWQTVSVPGKGSVSRVKDTASGGKFSLCLQQQKEGAQIQAYTYRDLKEPLRTKRTIVLRCKAMADNVRNAFVVFTAGTPDKPQLLWKSVFAWSGGTSFDWKPFETRVELAPGTRRLVISIRSAAPGTIWFDDFTLEWADEVKTEKPGAADALPAFPQQWKQHLIPGGETIAEFSSPEPGVSLLRHVTGGRSFGLECTVPAEEGKSYEFTTFAKTVSGGKAALEACFIGRGGMQSGSAGTPAVSAESWKKLSVVFTIPRNAPELKLVLLNDEQGTVLFRSPALRRTSAAVRTAADVLPFEFKLLPVDSVRVWSGKNVFHSFSDAPMPLAVHFRGRKSELKNPSFTVEYPAELKLTGAFPGHTSVWRAETGTSSEILRDGKPYRRTVFRDLRAFSILLGDYAWERKLILGFLPVSGKPGNFGTIFFRGGNDGKSGAETTVEFIALGPQPERRMPEKFRIIRWFSHDFIFPDDENVNRVASELERAGIRSFAHQSPEFRRGTETAALLEKRGWKLESSIPWSLSLKFLPEKYARQPAGKIRMTVMADGTVSSERMCPEYYTSDPEMRKALESLLAETVKTAAPKPGEYVLLNIEPWNTLDWCFCPFCREKFARLNGLKNVPSAGEIRSKHADDWVKFRTANTAEQVRLYAEAVRRFEPSAKVGLYDYVIDYRNPEYRNAFRSFSIDPGLSEQFIDSHFQSYYHYTGKQAFDMMRINASKLKKAYIPVGANDGPGYLSAAEVLSPAKQRLMILAAAANGCESYAYYSGLHFDAAVIRAVGNAMAEIAVLEPLLSHAETGSRSVTFSPRPFSERRVGTRILAFPGRQNTAAFASAGKNGGFLVFLFNYDETEPLFTDVKAELPAGKYTLLDPVSGIRLGTGTDSGTLSKTGFLVKTAPEDVSFVLIRRETPEDSALKSVPFPEKEFQEAKARWLGKNSFRPSRTGAFAADMVPGADGTPLLRLSAPGLTADLDPEGRILAWNGIRGMMLSEERLWLPERLRGELKTPAKLVRAGTDSSGAFAEYSRKIPNSGIEIVKTFRAGKIPGCLEVELAAVNRGPAPEEISLWVRCVPPRGTGERTAFRVPVNGKLTAVAAKGTDSVFPGPAGRHDGFGNSAAKDRLSSGECFASGKAGTLKTQTDPAQLMMRYFYLSPLTDTCEWMYLPANLKAGESFRTRFSLAFSGANG